MGKINTMDEINMLDDNNTVDDNNTLGNAADKSPHGKKPRLINAIFVPMGMTIATLLGGGVAQEAKAQVALDQTVYVHNENGEIIGQLYKTIAFANGTDANYDPNDHDGPGNPSYTIVGNKNIAEGSSGRYGAGPLIWRNDGSEDGVFVDSNGYTEYYTTFEPETVGGHTLQFGDGNSYPALEMPMSSDENEIGLNYVGEKKRGYVDINNDGYKDAQITTYTLPIGQEALDQGFQVGDVAIFQTPELANRDGAGTLLSGQTSYKVLNENLEWEDTTTLSPIYPEHNMIDWVEAALSTNEVKQENAQIYPNPVRDHLFVKLPAGVEVENFGIYNAVGQQVSGGEKLTQQMGIDLTTLPKGVYYLKARTNKNTVVVEKIIKK